MHNQDHSPRRTSNVLARLASTLAASLMFAFPAHAVDKPADKPVALDKLAARPRLAPCSAINMVEQSTITLGKSTLIKLPAPAVRLLVGGLPSGYAGAPVDLDDDPKAAQQARQGGQGSSTKSGSNGVADVDVVLLSPSELYLLGKKVGSMNVILQSQDARCTVMDIAVIMDAGSLQAKLASLMPGEKNIKVAAAEDSLILTGEVSDALKVERAMTLAAAYAPEKKLVNLLRTSAPQQVMLEVQVAEVSKTLLDKLGAELRMSRTNGSWTYLMLSDFLTAGGGLFNAFKSASKSLSIDGEKGDGVVRVLAEPNIMAISGQSASFLSGGKIFIPVAQSQPNNFGAITITLEEKEFGVGLKFTPTVLDGDRINLKVASEVSELSQTGSPFSTVGGATAVLPSMTTRRADTTVQLRDGQSFAIAGLIKNNLTESVKRFPVLGEVPVLGTLFRSAEFQKDMTELMFVITPRLVKPLPSDYALPTDSFIEPGRAEFLLGGKLEGGSDRRAEGNSTARAPAPQGAGGFETR